MELSTERDPDGGWYDRFVRVEHDGSVLTDLGKDPTLDQLREASREHAGPTKRLDLWQQGLVCIECKNQINGRFSARLDGQLLCWDCATDEAKAERGDLNVNVDPTKTVLSESKLHEKSLCDYVINVATGCRHGCRFCYVPSTPAVSNRDEMLANQADVDDAQRDWGSYLLYRDDLPERTRRGLENTGPESSDWKTTERGRGVVMLSSGTDCYQDRRTAQITRGVVQELAEAGVSIRILTRSPNVTRDIDLFREYNDRITVGTSIPSFDASLVRAMEPGAAPPMARWEALDQIRREAGIPVFVSFSPTYPTMDRESIREAMTWFKALDPSVIFHEPMNPRGANFEMCVEAAEEVGYENVAEEMRELRDEHTWREYALEQIQLVHEVAETLSGPPIHTWPDQRLIESTNGQLRQNLINMKKSVSPETFAHNESNPPESESEPESGVLSGVGD
jgi:DNA repair photolyase